MSKFMNVDVPARGRISNCYRMGKLAKKLRKTIVRLVIGSSQEANEELVDI